MDWPIEFAGDAEQAWIAWMQGVADVVAPAVVIWVIVAAIVLVLPWLAERRVRAYRFWCTDAGRAVEVQVEERRLPGLRGTLVLRTCSCFEPPGAIDCQRRCLDSDFRRQWQPVVPAVR